MTLAATALIPAAGHNPDLANVDPGLLQTWERVQKRFGRDLPINSGFRSPKRNFASGGAKKSQHMHGKALDIDVRDLSKADRKRLIQIASEEGISGIGVYGNALHFDTGPRRAWGPSHKKESIPGWARGTVGKHLYQRFEGSAGSDTLEGGDVSFDDLRRLAQEADKRLGGDDTAPAPLGSAQEATQAAPAPAGVTFDQLQQMAAEADQRLGGRQVDPSVTEGAQGAFGTRVDSGIDQVSADIQSAQQPGLLERAGDWIGEKIHGNSELDAPEIEGELTRRDPFSSPIAQALRNANPVASAFLPERDQEMEDLRRRLFMAETEADMAPILREAFPEAQFGVDGNGNQFVNLDGDWFALDKSGLSMRDAQEVIKEGPLLVGGATLGARLGLKAVGGTAGRVLGSGVGTAAGDAGVQMMNVHSGSGADFSTFRTAMAGAFGAGGEAVFSQMGRILGPIFASSRTFRGGRITAEGRSAIERARIDPEVISDSFASHFQRRVREASGATDEAVRMAIADEFQIPLTRGQATGDVSQSAFEEAARNEARGAIAGRRVRQMDEQARTQVGAAVDDIAKGLGDADTALGAAERAGGAIKDAAGIYRQAADDAYTALSETGATVPGRVALNLGDTLKRGVEMGGTIIDEATPNAAQAVQFINKRFAGGERGSVGFDRIESTRQRINALVSAARKGSNGADEFAMLEIKQGYDTWVDRLFTRALLDGDPTILAKARQARGAWTEWKRNFFKQGPKDDAGRAIETMVEVDVTPEEVARLLYGGVAVGEKGSSVRLAMKLKGILPDDAWNNVRAGAWLRLTETPAGRPTFGPERLAGRIEAFVGGNGSSMSKVLYTGEERALMGRLAKALRILVPPKEATNPSKTSYGNARLAQDTFRSLAAVLGFSEGGLSGGLGSVIATAIPSMARDVARGASIPAKRATGPGRGGAGGMFGPAEQTMR
ncbi:MAG: D-Ala-D-Ala carboxypeptidase family metallohydrolase [Pseudomonadota bacterium]